MHKRKLHLLVLTIAAFIGLVFMLMSTTPDRLGPLGILMFFSFVMVAVSALFYLLISVFKQDLKFSKKLEFSLILAMAPVVMLALSSVDQLSLADVVLISVFELIIVFYVSKVSQNRGK